MAFPRLILSAALGVAVGLGAGYAASRLSRAPRLPPRLARSPALQGALVAYESGDRARFEAAVSALALDPPADEAGRAEADLLGALASGGEGALDGVVRRHPGTSAAARALWLEAQRGGTGEARERLLEAFRRAFPGSWLLARRGAP